MNTSERRLTCRLASVLSTEILPPLPEKLTSYTALFEALAAVTRNTCA
jgi:hypothetical protein